MTIDEWINDFQSYINELQMPRDDYKGIMAYIDEVAELLKEQEPTRVESVGYGTDMFKRYRCQTCKAFFDHKYNYCPNCGRKVKWDDK